MGLLDNIFNNDDKKKKAGNNNNPLANIRKNIENFGKPNTFHGQGQSLGGSKPGDVLQIILPEPGPLGVRIEKKSNNSAGAIVNQVVDGSQAHAAGLQRGDILCFAGSQGQNEIPYDMFLEIAKSSQRPIHLEARRFVSSKSTGKGGTGSADAEARRRAMIAAAEAREKKHKTQSKPMQRVTKSTLLKQQSPEQNDVNNFSNEESLPQTEASRKAAVAAKQGEANLAAQLGYNPYDVVKKTAGQARSATSTTQHGAIQAPSSGNSHIPKVSQPKEAISAVLKRDALPSEFWQALDEICENPNKEASKNGLKIARKLSVNATTKGQNCNDEQADKFRKVRLVNPKIQAAIVDVPGNLSLMLLIGFQLTEDSETQESLLVFPPFYKGPDWLDQGLKVMEERENSL